MMRRRGCLFCHDFLNPCIVLEQRLRRVVVRDADTVRFFVGRYTSTSLEFDLLTARTTKPTLPFESCTHPPLLNDRFLLAAFGIFFFGGWILLFRWNKKKVGLYFFFSLTTAARLPLLLRRQPLAERRDEAAKLGRRLGRLPLLGRLLLSLLGASKRVIVNVLHFFFPRSSEDWWLGGCG